VTGPMQEAFGLAVRQFRHASGLSQAQLAEASALHETYISQVEHGRRNLTLRAMCQLSGALSVPLSQLVARAEDLTRTT